MYVALSSIDYARASKILAFPAGSTDSAVQCLAVTIADNTVLDGDKIFTVTLFTTDLDVVLGNYVTTITIIDDESKANLIIRYTQVMLYCASI